jgi:hypothetical protein
MLIAFSAKSIGYDHRRSRFWIKTTKRLGYCLALLLYRLPFVGRQLNINQSISRNVIE